MKEKGKRYSQGAFDDMEDNIGIVMPILTECDVDEDFSEGMDQLGEVVPILPLRNMVLFPGVAMPVMIGRVKSMRLAREAARAESPTAGRVPSPAPMQAASAPARRTTARHMREAMPSECRKMML